MSAAAVTQGILDLLRASGALGALITTFEGQPAIFMAAVAPEDADLPYVQSLGVERYPPGLNMDSNFREVSFSVEAYTKATGDPLLVNQIADVIATLFEPPSSAFAVTGFEVKQTAIDGPVSIDSDDDTYGRSVAVRCWLYKP